MLPNGKYKFTPKSNEELSQYKVIVVDEVSMLPSAMWHLLLSHGIYIIAAGDPGQLPPIEEADNNHVLDKPHVFLDEIMRQAQDSEIIRLSMWIRDGKPIYSYKPDGNQVMIIDWSQLREGMYEWADQIICATNDRRILLNQAVRRLKGFTSDEPEIGDKIISLHNNWDFSSASGTWALTNGMIGTLTNYYNTVERVPLYIYDKPIIYMNATFDLEDGDYFQDVPIDYEQLKSGQATLTGPQCYKMKKNEKCPDPPFDFGYAYAISCWKAQGSEYDKVLGFEEGHPTDKLTHTQYLYTMVTRAKEKIVIVRK